MISIVGSHNKEHDFTKRKKVQHPEPVQTAFMCVWYVNDQVADVGLESKKSHDSYY